MKKLIRRMTGILFLSFLIMFPASVEARTIIKKEGEGNVFGKGNYVYYCLNVKYTDYLMTRGVHAYPSEDASGGFPTKEYAYTLCDKKFKQIDPGGWHSPKKAYTYAYILKPGTYYIKINTGKKRCGYYSVECELQHADVDINVSVDFTNMGGKTKSKAKKLKALSKWPRGNNEPPGLLIKDRNYISFPLLATGKNASSWFKYYSDGKKPVYAVVRTALFTGKWNLVVYGPSYPNGETLHFPDKCVIDDDGCGQSHFFYKNGKKVNWGTTITLFRSQGNKKIGPKKGWYYFKIEKRKTPGKEAGSYKKYCFLGDIYVTKSVSMFMSSFQYSDGTPYESSDFFSGYVS